MPQFFTVSFESITEGTEVDFIPLTSAASFDVGESRKLKVASGDWLLLKANHGKEFINGERVQVKALQDGRIALADGRTLPAGFNTFTHGWAVTSHSSQSKTVDEVLLVASSNHSPPSTVNNFKFQFRGAASVSTFSPMIQSCSASASRIRTNARRR